MAGAADMVEAWGNVLTIIGNTLSVWTEIILFDSFFPRKKSGKTYWLFVAVGILAISSFSFFIGSSDGYTLKILFEVAFYYILCAILYQSRWDRRLFIAVTTYGLGTSLCVLDWHVVFTAYRSQVQL